MKNDIKVSLYGRKESPNSVETSLIDMLNQIRNGTFKDNVLRMREKYDTDPEAYKNEKSQLPAFTPSGTFKGKKASDIDKHSGYICIDIDGKDNPHIEDFAQLRDELAKIKNVDFSGLSPSGKGVFCLVKITDDPKLHKQHFNALMICFNAMNIFIDEKCDNINRLRFMSYDPDCYLNESDSIPFTGLLERKPKKSDKVIPSTSNKMTFSNKQAKDTLSKVEEIVTKIENQGIDITGDYGQWLRLGFALANEFGEEGRDFFERISQQSPSYNMTTQTDDQYNSCLNAESSGGGVSIGTFFHIAKEHGL